MSNSAPPARPPLHRASCHCGSVRVEIFVPLPARVYDGQNWEQAAAKLQDETAMGPRQGSGEGAHE